MKSERDQKIIYLYSASEATVDSITSLVSTLNLGVKIKVNCNSYLSQSDENNSCLSFFDFNSFSKIVLPNLNNFIRNWVFINDSDYIHEQVFKAKLHDVINLKKEKSVLLCEIPTIITSFYGDKLVENSTSHQIDTVSLPCLSGKDLVLAVKDVKYIQASGAYCDIIVNCDNKDIQKSKVTIKGNLKSIENKLNYLPFYRIHKSFIINLNWVIKNHKYPKNTITLIDGSIVPLARRRKLEFYNEYRIFNTLDI